MPSSISSPRPARRGYDLWKRLLDFWGALCLLLLLLPLLLVIAVLVRWRLGGPVLFRQERPGLNGRIFEMIKFRSMHDARFPDGTPRPDGARLTGFGKLLRALSLDELPELWNVVRGDMSLVGPRPLLVRYLERYTPEQARRHEVRPGITGWAQVSGRNSLTWEGKFELDVWYVDNRSLSLDLLILFRTAVHVISPRGISADGEATVSEFLGTESESEKR